MYPPRAHPPSLDCDADIDFQVIDWYIPDSDRILQDQKRNSDEKSAPEDYTMFMFGATAEGTTVCTKVTGFMPYFFVKPPAHWTDAVKSTGNLKRDMLHKSVEKRWYNRSTKKYETYMGTVIPKKLQDGLKYMKVVHRKDFVGFTNEALFPYIKIRVSTMALFNVLKRWFGEPAQVKEGFKICESNLEPFLRFIHEQDIKPCGWVRLPAGSFSEMPLDDNSDTFSRTAWNVEISHENVVALDYNKIAPLLVASFDIECTSSHGDFPVAKKDYKKLAGDLINVARYNTYDTHQLRAWILKAYDTDIQVNKDIIINRVYPKYKAARAESKLTDKFLTELLDNIQSAAAEKGSLHDSDNEGQEDGDNDKPVVFKRRADTVYERTVTKLLTDALPPLKGDPVIQIGTTVNRYGSDDIIYKHIVTLNSCDDIPGAETETYADEGSVILAWKEFITRLDPDIITGYNIFGFDMKYIWERAEETGVLEEFAIGLGRIRGRRTALETKQLSSSALGDNIMYIIDTDGIVCIDQFKVTQRDEKLESYKLDFVAHHFLKDNKNDLKPREIFEKFGGSSADRAEIAKYCLQDCALVNRLLHNRKVIQNNVGMGNVCYVPLKYLFMRGQGIKIFSLVAKECRQRQFIIPVLQRTFGEDIIADDEEGYEGAIVLQPQTGMYLEDPISVLDYNSLYPSSMISRNISHDCYVMDDAYRRLDDAGVSYTTVEYDIYEGKGDKKRAVGKKSCTFAQLADGRKGIMPSILMMLLDARKNTRKKIEFVSAQLTNGSTVSGLMSEKGGSVTFTNPETKNTVVVSKDDIVEIKDAYTEVEKAILDSLQVAYKVTANSLYGQCGSRTSPIYLKEIAAATTATGREMICIARDFVTKQYDAEVIYGDSVMPYTPITVLQGDRINVKSIEKLAGDWVPYPQFKAGQDNRHDKEQSLANDIYVWTNAGWARVVRVIRHRTVKKIYRVRTDHGLVDVTEDHSLLASDHTIIKPGTCTVGTELLHSPVQSTALVNTRLKLQNDDSGYIQANSPVTAQEYYLLLQKRGYNVTITCDNSVLHTQYCLTYTKETSEYNKSIRDIYMLHAAYTGYVYDIETEYGVFHAGIGDIIVKNTDSIFCKFPVYDQETNERLKGRAALPGAIAAGQRAAEDIKSILPKHQALAYEKTMFPFILFSKKRYVGNLYEDDPNATPKQKSMGIALKRRDYAPIVKKMYGGVIDILLNQPEGLGASVSFLKQQLQDLVDGKFPLEDLIISKTLKGEYKDPSKIAHKVLADRIGERDEGNKPMVNDRIPFVYIHAPDAKLQGERIEHPDYIREQSIRPDYQFYITNQLMKPITQLYSLCVESIPGYAYPPGYWIQLDIEMQDHRLYTDSEKRKDRIQVLKMKEVEDVLFKPFMVQKIRAVKAKAPPKKPVRERKHTETIQEEPKQKRVARKKNETPSGGLTVKVVVDKKSIVGTVHNGSELVNTVTKPKGDLLMNITSVLEGCLQDVLREGVDINVQINNQEFVSMFKKACEMYSKELDWNVEFKKCFERQDVGLQKELQVIQNMGRLIEMHQVAPLIIM